jgi:ABC-type nitrate/sulfonate/bicarbonate transport system ATPase subunit
MEHLLEAPRSVAGGGLSLAGVVRILGGKAVLDGLDLDVAPHERLGIVGRSGTGKSTLLSLVAGLDEPDRGVISVAGAGTAAARLERCALMPQGDSLLPWRTALDNACLALENAGLSRTEARDQAKPLYSRFGLQGSEALRPARLSAGMRQRVAFLRTLLARKDVLLLDEPFGALDAITRGELQEWLGGALAEEPQTVLLVTHDIEEALLLCDRVAVLAGGRIATVLDVDVERDVADPAFVELRRRALEAIA